MDLVKSKKTMSSIEIAELTGKRHDNVLKDIADQLGRLEGGVLRFEDTYLSAQNKKVKCYKLPYRETMILVSGYSVELRTKVIDRWMALETANSKRVKSELDIKSTKARNSLTDQWKDHGLVGKEYAIATVEEYKAVFKNPEIRKHEMTIEQKARLLIFETMEMLKLQQSPDVTGLPMVKQSIHATNTAIEMAYKTIGLSI